MKRPLSIFLSAILIVPTVALAPAGAQLSGGEIFLATLGGDAEVPPVNTSGSGVAAFTVSDDGSSMDYVLLLNDVTEATQAHIHIGGATENGPAGAFLLDFNAAGITQDGQIATGTLTDTQAIGMTLDDLVGEMRDGNGYVNVHDT
ncbi:MAG TPA: CHRD domain-containing protein, partial [Actinobacteria bacterium]|nr:CHRD domain-containing protein [Actinomycetota bacterium]